MTDFNALFVIRAWQNSFKLYTICRKTSHQTSVSFLYHTNITSTKQRRSDLLTSFHHNQRNLLPFPSQPSPLVINHPESAAGDFFKRSLLILEDFQEDQAFLPPCFQPLRKGGKATNSAEIWLSSVTLAPFIILYSKICNRTEYQRN